MASVKVCFAVGLLMTAFSTAVLGVTQDIPDDVVYTDVTKTLIRNNTGVLTCRFKGNPLAVYWKKGSDPTNAPLLVRLYDGEKGGPRYEDGSCDIDENYSLVIKRVRTEDTGLYTCRVASYKGNLIQNFTGVTTSDTAVKTRSVISLEKGRPGVLPCEPIIRPKKISWLRSPNKLLVTLEHSGNTPERSGSEYAEGLFNITKEYSLFIEDVMVMHEDRYVCEVTDYDTDNLFQNGTVLKVFHFPFEPFPSIEGCPQEEQNLSACTLRITSRTMLTCQVEGYYPNIDLFFVHGSERVDSLETRVWNNSDGTKSKRITISFDGSSDTVFECVAAGLIGQADTRSITVHLIRDDQQSHVAVAVAVPMILVSTIIVMVFLVFKRRKTHFKRDYNTVPMVYKPTGEEGRDIITLEEYHIVAKIPTDEQGVKDITIQVIEKAPFDLIPREDETIIAVGLKFSPPGLQFSTPLRITVPHSAIFTNPTEAKIVLYTRANDKDSFSRVPSADDGTPRCVVRQDDLDLYIDHFSEWWIITYIRDTFIGKRLMCTPYIPVSTARSGCIMLVLCLEDDTFGPKKVIPEFKVAGPRIQYLVRWGHGNLSITYLVNNTELSSKIVEVRQFYYLTSHLIYFPLDPKDWDGLEVMVKFILRQFITEEIMFPVVFQEQPRAMSSSTQTHQMAAASAMARNSSLDSRLADSPEDEVTDAHVLRLSELLKPSHFLAMHVALGIRRNTAVGILTENKERYPATYAALLHRWKEESERTLDNLDEVLLHANVGGLIPKYRRCVAHNRREPEEPRRTFDSLHKFPRKAHIHDVRGQIPNYRSVVHHRPEEPEEPEEPKRTFDSLNEFVREANARGRIPNYRSEAHNRREPEERRSYCSLS